MLLAARDAFAQAEAAIAGQELTPTEREEYLEAQALANTQLLELTHAALHDLQDLAKGVTPAITGLFNATLASIDAYCATRKEKLLVKGKTFTLGDVVFQYRKGQDAIECRRSHTFESIGKRLARARKYKSAARITIKYGVNAEAAMALPPRVQAYYGIKVRKGVDELKVKTFPR